MNFLIINLGNSLALQKYFDSYNSNQLKKQVDPGDWKIHASILVNAFYYSALNSIEIPSGILSSPLFDSNVPNYLNYGALGYIIGHEITHGFDTSGRARNYLGI